LRSLFVSRRWMIAYCFAKQSSNVAWGDMTSQRLTNTTRVGDQGSRYYG
jgi:hypothetical protein